MKKITSFEYNTILFLLIRASFIEVTVKILINMCKEDAWISIILGIILGIAPFCIFQYIKNKNPDKNIINIVTENFKHSHFIINTFIISVLIFTTCNLWNLIHFIDSQFLYKTSTWIITSAVIIPICYAATKDINTISKVTTILFYIIIIFMMFIIFGLTKGINIENIKPILNTNPKNIINGAILFIAFNILPLFLLTIIPNNKIINNKNNFICYVLATISLLNIMFLTITIFGIDLAALYDYPSFHLLKRVIVLEIIDRIESILSLEWIFSLFIIIIIGLFFIKETLNITLKKTNNKIIIVICIFMGIVSNIIFKTHGTSEHFYTHYLIYILYISFFILPLIIVIKNLNKIHLFHNKDTNNSNNT